jgi:hypothetical protein
MLSWDLLNNIIETRMEVPLKTNLEPTSEQEKDEIAMYYQSGMKFLTLNLTGLKRAMMIFAKE